MSTSIVSDSYAIYGTRIDGPPDRPEPVRRVPKSLNKAAAMKHLHMSEADFDVAIGLKDPKFPSAQLHTLPGWASEVRWRDTELERWQSSVQAHIDFLQRLVPRTK